MRLLRRIIFCSCFTLSLLAQQKSTTPGPGGFQISGSVVDSATGQLLSNARVAVAPVSARNAFMTMITAEDGRFFFPGLAPGKYTLTAQRRGFLTQALNQHEQYSSSIAVGPDLDSNNLVFRLTPYGVISGTVTDDQGDEVREAQVMLFQSSIIGGVRRTRSRAITNTDDEGSYHFAHLPAGRYFIAVSAYPWYAQTPPPPQYNSGDSAAIDDTSGVAIRNNGSSPENASAAEEPQSPLDVTYPVTFYGGGTEADGATPIVLGAGGRASIEVILHTVPALHLLVHTGNSDPSTQASVAVVERVFDGMPAAVHSENRQVAPGVVEVVGIPPGHYNMMVNTYNNSNGAQALMERDIEASGNGEPDFAANTSVPLSAQLRFAASGSVPENVRLLLNDKKSWHSMNVSINSTGEAEFKSGVPPGSYEVSLLSGEQVFIKSISASGARVVGRTVELKGTSPVKLDVVLEKGEGQVVGLALREGKPFAGAMIVLVPPDAVNNQSLVRRDQSDSDGTFTLSNIVPGSYTVLAIKDGWDLEWANPEALKQFMAQGEAVTVEPRGKYSVKVKVQ